MSLTAKLIPDDLRPIYDKVLGGSRITDGEALQLYRSRDINALGVIANLVRERKNGNTATYIHNQYINYSNVCVLSCQFCAFGAKKRDAHAFETSIDEIVEKVRHALTLGITEIHMVGGLPPDAEKRLVSGTPHPGCVPWIRIFSSRLSPLSRFATSPSAFSRNRSARPSKNCARPAWGRSPAAEPRSSTKGCANKFAAARRRLTSGREAHRTWHEMGMRSTCTMLFGHVETYAHRVDHLRRLRALQDETGGFTGFVPFACVPETTALAHVKPATAMEELLNLAVCRIYLDNFDHITAAYWVSSSCALASLALNYGVDDLHGTIMEEKIFHMAGATTPTRQQTVVALEKAIRASRAADPVQRDTKYRHIASTWRPAASEPQPAPDLACA